MWACRAGTGSYEKSYSSRLNRRPSWWKDYRRGRASGESIAHS